MNAHNVTECPALDFLKETEQLIYLHVFLSEDVNFRITHKKCCLFRQRIIIALVHWASDRSSG